MNIRKSISLAAALLFAASSLVSCLRAENAAGSDLPPDTPSGGLEADTPGIGIGDTLGDAEGVEILAPADDTPTVDVNADFYPDGLFIYGDAVYTQSYFYEEYAKIYAQMTQYYKQTFGCRVSAVVAPVSSMTIDNPKITALIPSQKEVLDQMAPLFGDTVNFPNPYEKLAAHKNEYLYFRTDHHWTQRGAYYAYAAFAESVGFTPTPLEDFGYAVINSNYFGSLYEWTKDERVKSFRDEVEVFHPTKSVHMHVEASWGEELDFDTCIVDEKANYIAFLYGDHPFITITVPDNPQNLACLVLKDSFGNAFVPFLCEHYGTVLVVDPRTFEGSLFDRVAPYSLTDIIFVNNVEAANSIAWPRLFMGCLNITLP
ncbi:MAG: hypothetical protein II889_11130 [Clostridia bacterium]|nr:hypothetical protein [Clostridia bacterium]